MTQEQIQYIRQALQDSAQDIQSREQAVQGLFNASRFLLRSVNKLDSETVGVSEDGVDLRYDFYQRVLESADKWYGVTYQADRPQVVEAIRRMTDSGLYPVRLWE